MVVPVLETAGQQVSYTLDDVGNRTELGYPSGHTVAQAFDPLDRPSQIGPGTAGVPTENAVSYGYRGPHLLATMGYANGISGTRQFDAARRRTAETKVTPGNSTVFQESFSWSPRSLKTAYSRGDLNGRGFAVAYDGAQRVLQAAQHPAPTTLAANNSSLVPDALTAIPEAFSYQYDAAQNLISQTTKEDGIPGVEATPTDASGRNRPASIHGISLAWDANGNLIQRGDLTLEYDFRNRLTRVSQGATEIAQYEYDAFNRRVTKQVDGTTETTAWSGWQPIEEYRAVQIRQRRTYGLSLDEIVRLETDVDGNGVLDPAQVPLYDETGNVAVVTDGSGKPVERYEYTPFGEKTILVDSIAPQVEQVRWVNGDLVLEISEAVNGDALSRALTAGTLTLEKTATWETLEMTVDQPVETEPQTHRRVVLTLTDPSLIMAPDEVRLTVPPEALEDLFLNRPSSSFELTFPWPSADTVLHDSAAPEVLEILLYDGVLQIELSEPVDLATANSSVGVGTPSLTWAASADGYTLSTVETLADGDYTLSVGTGLQDLAGTALSEALSVDFTVTATVPKQRLFEAPNPQETTASTIGNPFGFHGLPQDAETGLVYVRNRYYDPEIGRFISADPLGYVDGPSMYQYGLNSPQNFTDPLGLENFAMHENRIKRFDGRMEKETEILRIKMRLAQIRRLISLREAAVESLEATRGQHRESKLMGLATRLHDQDLVPGPAYDANTMAAGLLGALPCDNSREVVCSFEGTGKHARAMELGVGLTTELAFGSLVASELALAPWASYADELEEIQLLRSRQELVSTLQGVQAEKIRETRFFGQRLKQLKTRRHQLFETSSGPVRLRLKAYRSELPGGEAAAREFFEAATGQVPRVGVQVHAEGRSFVYRWSSREQLPTVEVVSPRLETVEKIRFLMNSP